MAIRLFSGRRAPRTAFVLGGGGNLGAAQVGMLRALAERGFVPDVVVGSSVGALNAAAVATRPGGAGVRRLEELWQGLRGDDVFPSGRLSGPWQLALRGEALHSNEGLRRVIEGWLDVRLFEETLVPLHVVATSLSTGRERWFSSGDLVIALLASAALPALFPPVRIDGELYIDGGVVDNVPVSKAIEVGANRIYVLHAGNNERTVPELRRPLDVLLQAFAIARGYRFRAEVESVPDGVELITLPGVHAPPARYNDFGRTGQLIELAYRSSKAFLDARAAGSALAAAGG